ncbi:MAG: PLP-dependent aspartate aminotransferase family protein [Chloroflexota bacterium]
MAESEKINAEKSQLRGYDKRYAGMDLETQCVHAGMGWERPDVFSPNVPIYNGLVYYFDRIEELDDMIYDKRTGYAYARWGSPTVTALERALSTLEGAEATLACSSGMAAVSLALFSIGLTQDTPILCSNDVYGSTFDLVKNTFPTMGRRVILANFLDLAKLADIFDREHPRVIFFEVMTNPLCKVIDAPAVIEMAHRFGARVIVDNTFTTPYLFNPIAAGADFVCESLSKFIGGHSDFLGGSVSCRQADLEKLELLQTQIGNTLDANAAFLALRGLKTFVLRLEKHCANALELARFLENHLMIERVWYPGLPSHPQHATAKRIFQNGRFGGMMSFELRGGDKEKVFRFINALQLVLPAGSLGDVNSQIVYPARTTHHWLSEEELKSIGITPATLRLSVGIENVEDLKADLDRALRLVR